MDNWIKCSDRMPEPEIDVQVYCEDSGEQMVAYLDGEEGLPGGYLRFASWKGGEGIYCKPSHWQPLPTPPSN